MSTKKKFIIDNPAESFLSRVDQDTVQTVMGTIAAGAPEQAEPAKPVKEQKTRRVQLLVHPSVYEEFKALAEADGMSFNTAVGLAMRNYIKEHKHD